MVDNQRRKIKLVKYGLPIVIFSAILLGIIAIPEVLGSKSPYTAFMWALDGTFDTMFVFGYIFAFVSIQLLVIVLVISALTLKYTRHKSTKRWYSALFSLIAVSFFILAVLLLVIWYSTGLFAKWVDDLMWQKTPSTISKALYISSSYVLPGLTLAFGVIALGFWLSYIVEKLRLPKTKNRYKFDYSVFKNSPVPWSGKDKQLKIICAVGILVAVGEIVLTTLSVIHGNNDSDVYPTVWGKIWFGTMHHFTELSNLWVFVFFIVFLLNYKFKILKTSAYVTMTFVYISVTFFIADFLLAPFMALNHSSGFINMGFGGKTTLLDWIKTLLFHVVQPIMVLIFFIFFCKSKRSYQPWGFSKIVPVTMIFPILYLAYAIAINFLPILHFQKTAFDDPSPTLIYGGVSVYGYFTCVNSNIHASIFGVDGVTPVWSGRPLNGIWYGVAVCLFLGLTYYYNWLERHNMAYKYIVQTKHLAHHYNLNWN